MRNRTGYFAGWLLLAASVGSSAAAALRPETNAAFDRYLRELEQRRTQQQQSGCYLWLDCAPEIKSAVLAGQIVVKPITAVLPHADLHVPGGDIRHTLGATFIKGETIGRIRRVLDDYAHYPEIYGPDVVTARLTSGAPDDKELFLRVRKHFVITVVLNISSRVHWTTLDATHVVEHTTATHIGDAKNPDNPDAGDRTPEQDRGFLWRYESYWRLEETPQGLLVEHEMISLSRRPPASLRMMLRPILQRLPQESMYKSVVATRQQLLQRPKDDSAVSMNRSGTVVVKSLP